MSMLSELQGPADLRGMDEIQLAQLAVEIRDTIVATVADTGGHLGSSLGVVELTQGAEAIEAAGEELVRVGLVAGVPDDAIAR